MVEFRGVVNIDARGEVICFCSVEEAMRGKCECQNKYDCPEAIITFDIIDGSRPSEKGVSKAKRSSDKLHREVIKIREGVAQIEKAAKDFKRFRI